MTPPRHTQNHSRAGWVAFLRQLLSKKREGRDNRHCRTPEKDRPTKTPSFRKHRMVLLRVMENYLNGNLWELRRMESWNEFEGRGVSVDRVWKCDKRSQRTDSAGLGYRIPARRRRKSQIVAATTTGGACSSAQPYSSDSTYALTVHGLQVFNLQCEHSNMYQ